MDLSENPWCQDEYKNPNLEELLEFLLHKDKKSVKVSALETKSKEERIAEKLALAKAAAEEKQNTTKTASFTSSKKQKYLLKICGCESSLSVIKMDALCSNMTRNDAFIFDSIRRIYVWLDIEVNTYKRDKALYLATILSVEFDVQIKVVDRNRPNPSLEVEFWDDFGGKNDFIQPKSSALDEELSKDSDNFRIFTIDDYNDNGDCEIKEIEVRPISKTMLRSVSCVVLDDTRDVYVWKGSNTTDSCFSTASFKAESLTGEGERPECCGILYEFEGYEKTLFIEHFPDWRDNLWNSTEQERLDAMERKRHMEEEETRKETEMLRSQGVFTNEVAREATKSSPSPLPATERDDFVHKIHAPFYIYFIFINKGRRIVQKRP